MRVPVWIALGFKSRAAARAANPPGYRAAEYAHRLGENPPPKGQRAALRGHKPPPPPGIGIGIGGGDSPRDLLAAIMAVKRSQRLRLVAEVMVLIDPLNPQRYKAGTPANMAKIEKALADDEDEATVWIGAVYTKAVAQRRVQAAIKAKESWTELWSDLLSTEVTEVFEWFVVPLKS